MKGVLERDFAGKISNVFQKAIGNYSWEIGLAIGPFKTTLKASPTQNLNKEEEIER